MNKQILKNPDYLNVTYSNSKALPNKHLFKMHIRFSKEVMLSATAKK
tara:strand:+ start:1362 stop:1502 length:141 start_codon:yes stop_codon:yes gene_type:complete